MYVIDGVVVGVLVGEAVPFRAADEIVDISVVVIDELDTVNVVIDCVSELFEGRLDVMFRAGAELLGADVRPVEVELLGTVYEAGALVVDCKDVPFVGLGWRPLRLSPGNVGEGEGDAVGREVVPLKDLAVEVELLGTTYEAGALVVDCKDVPFVTVGVGVGLCWRPLRLSPGNVGEGEGDTLGTELVPFEEPAVEVPLSGAVVGTAALEDELIVELYWAGEEEVDDGEP